MATVRRALAVTAVPLRTMILQLVIFESTIDLLESWWSGKECGVVVEK